MLGLILERAGGAPYDRLLDTLILGPLGLRDTGFDRPAPVLPRRASGYRPDGLALAAADHMEMSWVYAAGGMYSTVGDLLKWEQALSRGDLLPRRVVDRMWAAGVGPYGYGWQVLAPSAQTLQRPLVLHAGGLNGFATDLLRYPGEDLTVVILANLGTVPLPRISRDLSAIALGEPYTPPVVRRPMAVDPAIYDTYAGVYQLTPQVSVSVVREGDRLIVQATGQPRDVAIPESETRFFSRLVDAQITFARDGAGRATQLVIHQGGKDSGGVAGAASRSVTSASSFRSMRSSRASIAAISAPSSCWTKKLATVAVKAPMTPMPSSISKVAMTRPSVVVGEMSP